MQDPHRIFTCERPSVGVVIGTYGSPCYVHLGLELLRRNLGAVPVLVHDDASFETDPDGYETLRRVCERYGARFSSNRQSQGHMKGDFTAFHAGWEWAARVRKFDLLVKFSRRFIPLGNWLEDLGALAYVTQYATYNNFDACHALGFRSECVAMHVGSWLDAGIVNHASELLANNTNWFVEVIIHNLARRVHRRNCLANRLYERVHPPAEPDLAFAPWPFMGGSRCARSPQYMWRDTYTAQEYHQKALDLGIREYGLEDFVHFKEH